MSETKNTEPRRLYALPDAEAEAVRANPKRVMTLLEAAAYLHHSPRKVRELVQLRRLPAVNLSGDGRGKLLFRLEDLDATLAKFARQAA
jgi:excisionase family DNA binding protein